MFTMRRLQAGLTLLVLVAAILVVAPTVVFWQQFGVEAVIQHWIWVAFLALLCGLGTVLVLTARVQPGAPNPKNDGPRRRMRLGFACYGLAAGILIFAPTIAFGWIFGADAVLAFWGSVILLVVMTFSGLFLIFTDKKRLQPGA